MGGVALMFQTVGSVEISAESREFEPRIGFVNRWELQNVHEYPNPRGTAWTATLCFGGLPVGLVENMGDGGSSWPMFNSSSLEDVWFSDIREAYLDADQERFIGYLVSSYDGLRIQVSRRGDDSVA